MDIKSLLSPADETESYSQNSTSPASASSASHTNVTDSTSVKTSSVVPAKRRRSTSESLPPAKAKSNWSEEEEDKLRKLCDERMHWNEISEQLPGRTPTSCRLHYRRLQRHVGGG